MFGIGYGICKAAELVIASNSDGETKFERDQQGRAVSLGLTTPIVMALDPVGTSAYIAEFYFESKRAEKDSVS